MKNYIYILAATLLSSSLAYSEEQPASMQQIESQYHRLYIGPDIFVEHARAKYTSRENKIDITSNTVFEGLRLGYDYLKPQAFYFGTDGLVAMGRTCVSNHSTYWSGYHPYGTNHRFKYSPLFANIEQRYGYTFQSPISVKSTLTPFAGIGWYYTRLQFDSSHPSANWFYGAAGLRATQEFCENFDVGFNLKAMYAFAGRRTGSRGQVKENVRNVWGYEVALPLTWHVGASKKWDLQFQPYLLKLDVNSISHIWGARLEAGYSF